MKFLFYCDYASISGFSHVSEKIIKSISENITKGSIIDIWGINYLGDEKKISDNVTLFSAYHEQNKLKGTNPDVYGRLSFLDRLRKKDYDKVIVINDLAVICGMYGLLQNIKDSYKNTFGKSLELIIYFPVDSKIRKWDIMTVLPDDSTLGNISVFDKIITYMNFGKKLLEDALKKYMPNEYLELVNRIKVIGHGIDKENLNVKDNSQLKLFKQRYFRANDKTFIIGQINRNSARKDIATSLQSYKLFLDMLEKNNGDTSNIRYYIHADPVDPMGINLYNVCAELEINANNVLFPPDGFNALNGTEDQYMGLIYNSFNIFMTATTAEGWGLTVCEAAYCDVPVICPCHTSFKEMRDELGFKFLTPDNIRETFFINDSERLRFQSDSVSLAFELYSFYSNYNGGISYNSMIKQNKEAAIKLDWNEIGKKWCDILINGRIIHI